MHRLDTVDDTQMFDLEGVTVKFQFVYTWEARGAIRNVIEHVDVEDKDVQLGKVYEIEKLFAVNVKVGKVERLEGYHLRD